MTTVGISGGYVEECPAAESLPMVTTIAQVGTERSSVTGERYSRGKGAPGERHAGDTAKVAPLEKEMCIVNLAMSIGT